MRRGRNARLALLLTAMIPSATIPPVNAEPWAGTAIDERSPRFEDYPVWRIFTGKPASPKLTTPELRRFRTRLRMGAREGPNFAGHYTVVVWGCGSSCLSVAIVDAMSGEVFFPDLSAPLTEIVAGIALEEGTGYRKESRLLITTEDGGREGYDRYYYIWEKSRLRRIKREHVSS